MEESSKTSAALRSAFDKFLASYAQRCAPAPCALSRVGSGFSGIPWHEAARFLAS